MTRQQRRRESRERPYTHATIRLSAPDIDRCLAQAAATIREVQEQIRPHVWQVRP